MLKEKKVTLLFTLFVILVGVFIYVKKPFTPRLVVRDDYIPEAKNVGIDSLKSQLAEQKKLNEVYADKIKGLEWKLDSIKFLIDSNKDKLANFKKRKKDEKRIDFSVWTDNDFTRYLSDRYK